MNGRLPGQHLVKRDAQSVEIASRIDRTIHSPRLFRRHVRECTGDELGRRWRLTFARKTRRDPETRELHITCFTYEDIVRLDVLMDQAALVDLFQCRGYGYGQRQKAPNLHRDADRAIQRMEVGPLVVGLR